MIDLEQAPLDLFFFRQALSLYANGISTSAVFSAEQLGFLPGELVELGQLLALMPSGDAARSAWVERVDTVFNAARLFSFPDLDSIAKCQAALGITP